MSKVPIASLVDADKLFIAQAANVFPCQAQFDAIDGPDNQIKEIMFYKYGGNMPSVRQHDFLSGYNGPLLAPTQASVQAFCAKQAAIPPTYMDRLYAVFGQDRQHRYQKLYDKYLRRG